MMFGRALGGLMTVALLALPSTARADFLDQFARLRAFAEETARVLGREPHSAAESIHASPATPTNGEGLTARRRGSVIHLDRLIAEAALRYGINPNLVRAVVAVESGYDPLARSPKGAMGLMQLMPGTATLLGVRDPWDPRQNLDGGIRFLGNLLAEFGDVQAALVGYNAGPEVVRAGRVIPAETRAYVHAVLSTFKRLTRGVATQ